ncbi:IucA/IucC family protein [Streptomyces sulphureus]|uniref:IucA/IucC family protein n=1 Tax=Streptomyces sulphureus TaxID=47758 RepID=UPI00036B45C1|nr:IucA/IucC family protein [Streptomyces sulphureus]
MNVRSGTESSLPGPAHSVGFAFPRQWRPQTEGCGSEPPSPACESAHEDLLPAPAPFDQADAAATENLLRCWVRETSFPCRTEGPLRVPLPASGTALRVPVLHASATGLHRFGRPRLEGVPQEAPELDAVTLAALISREAAHLTGTADAGHATELVGRVADSVQRTALFLTERRAAPRPPNGTGAFLEAEQALVFGHPLHPTPKSREGLSEGEARLYSPELRGSFPLHWYAADPSLIESESAWHEDDRTVPASELTARLAGADVRARLPEGAALLPLHPWQAREVRQHAAVQELTRAGLLHDLGPCGAPWHPTSSVRTVHRADESAMLKLSLGLRITNSRRENLRKELLRGAEVHRLLRSGLAAEFHAVHPGFGILRDPAWLGLTDRDGTRLPGFDTVLRENPFAPDDDAVCLAGLLAPAPASGLPPGGLRSRLAEVVESLAARTGRSRGDVAAEWLQRYLDAVVRPILWLDAHAGVALEAHQQNTLVLLDAAGWPAGGRYRDNQGYYFRVSHRAELARRLPGVGVASDSFVDDAVVDERFAYYLGINNVLGTVGTFGAQGLADEEALLAVVRRFLESAAAPADGAPASGLARLLLDTETLRCKANLLTRVQGLDELVGPVETQSVYVPLPNPLVGRSAARLAH